MKDKRTSGSWRTALECLLASMAMAVLTLVSFRLHAGPAMAALLFFFLVVLISLWAGFLSTAFACAVAALCFDYFFTQPLYHLWMSEPVEIAATIAFSGTALIISRLLARVRGRTAELQQTNEQLQAEIAERRRAEQGVRQREAELKQLVDAIPQQVFVFDADWSPLFANRRELEYTGLTSEEAQSKDAIARIFHPDDLKKLEALRERMRSEGVPSEMEARIRGKDGQYRWFLIRDNPLRDEQGRVLRWYGTRTDIEDRKGAEEALRQSETKLRREQSILAEAENLTHSGAWEWDVVSGAWSFSDEWLRIHGTDRKTLTPEELIVIAHPDDRQSILQAFEEVRKGERPYNIEHRIIQQDTGKVRVVRATGKFVRDEEGKVAKVYGCAQDITEQKQAEEALHRLNRELRALSNCNQTLLRSTDEQSLLHEICRIVCQEAGYRVAWVGYAEHDEAKSVRPVAWTGTEEGDVANLGITWADAERGRGIIGTAIRSGKTCCIKDYATDPEVAPWRESALQHGFRSAIALPLKDEHANISGSLNIYSAQPNAFTSEEIWLLEELAADLAFGIVTLRSRAAREQAEQGLRESEAYLAESQRLTHTGSWALDLVSDKYVYVSEEDFRLWGFDPQEGLPSRKAVFRRIHPEDRDKMRASFEKSLREKVDSSDEYRIVLPDGTVKHVHTIRHPVLNGAGDIVKLVGTSIDITGRKRAEEALSESERKYRELVEHANSIILRWTHDGRITFLNEFGLKFFGYSAEEIIGRQVVGTIVPPTETGGRDLRQLMLQVCAAPRAFEQNINENMRRNGERVTIAWTNKIVWGAQGEVAEILSVGTDITERRRAEEALRQSEAYLAESQRLTHTGSWAFDLASNKYIYASEECFRIFELDAQDRFPNREVISRQIHPEDWDRVNESFEKSLRERVDTSTEFRIVLPSGTVKHIQAIRHPVMNDAGDIVKLVGTAIDMTEHKRAEEERERLDQLEADLARINRVSMMGELAASIAHEVNQPLSGVVVNGNACLRWLAGDSPNLDEAREAVRRIVRDGKRAGDVIARIRALATKTATAKERLDMNEAIREVVALAGDELRKNRVAVRTEFAPDLLPVLGDRVQLQQVVLNLVMNGIEAMSSVEERPRELTIRTQNDDADLVRVTVQDSGMGLDPQSMERIFDAFYTTKRGGMGMGLSISRSIIQNHGGKLWAVANDGPGMSVQFTIPKYH